MLHGMKSIMDFLGITQKRLRTFVAGGAPIRVVGGGNGKRYVANRQALNDWVCCREQPGARGRAKAG